MTGIDTAPEILPSPAAPHGRWRSARETALLYVLSVFGALAISAVLVAMTGNSWPGVFKVLFDGAFLAPGRWGNTLTIAMPMLLVAVGTTVAVRAGLFNIGQEGQLLMGAMLMAVVGTKIEGPGVLLLLGGLALGSVAGGAYAGISAVMRYRRGVPEVISTLLLVFIALQVTGFAVTTDWFLRDTDPTRPQRAQNSAALGPDTHLPVIRVFGNELSLGVVIAVVIAVAVAYLLARTIWGFRFRVLGHNARIAQKIGIAATRNGTLALFISGALAGLAGAVMLASGSSSYRFTPGFSTNIGWQGLLVALVARSRPLVCIPMAIVFAALRTGAGFLASTGVDRKIVDVTQALLVLALLIPPAVVFLRNRRRAIATVSEAG
ncbi:MAG TPA: ABC transporter permease [Acidimicrobiia bacterium]|nr:ABC transporter permease [Acidimicrobiia bacterium]